MWPSVTSHTQACLDLRYAALVGPEGMTRLKIVRNERLIEFEQNKNVFPKLLHIYNGPHDHQYLWNESVNILDFFTESQQLKETSEGITFSCV